MSQTSAAMDLGQQSLADAKPMAQVTLQTPRLTLRPIRMEDAADVMAIRNQSEVSRWLRTHITSLAEAENWVRQALDEPKAFCFAIEVRESAQDPASTSTIASNTPGAAIVRDTPAIIGTMGTRQLPNIGYSLHPAYWGRGYATEALRAVVERYWSVWPEGCPYLSDEDRPSLVAGTFVENIPSQNVLRKAGFQPHGEGEIETPAGSVKIKKWRKWGPGFGPSE